LDVFNWGVFNGKVHSVHHRSEFLVGEIGELVQGDSEATGFFIPVSDEVSIGSKDLHSVLVFFFRSIDLLVNCFPGSEGTLVLNRDRKGNSQETEKDGEHRR
jgi:hypothetical protein